MIKRIHYDNTRKINLQSNNRFQNGKIIPIANVTVPEESFFFL
jgi:hypothetical protein